MKRKKLVLIAAAILMLYILSVGPVSGIFARFPAIRTVQGKTNRTTVHFLLSFYAPLRFVAKRVPAFKTTMSWYIDLFLSPEDREITVKPDKRNSN